MKRSKNSIGRRIVKSLTEFSDALETGEAISEKFTCRKVVLDVRRAPPKPATVKATRKLLNASQTVFAQFLGVRPTTVRSWEQGLQTPGDMACRFLDEIRFNPAYWRQRLSDSLRVKQAS